MHATGASCSIGWPDVHTTWLLGRSVRVACGGRRRVFRRRIGAILNWEILFRRSPHDLIEDIFFRSSEALIGDISFRSRGSSRNRHRPSHSTQPLEACVWRVACGGRRRVFRQRIGAILNWEILFRRSPHDLIEDIFFRRSEALIGDISSRSRGSSRNRHRPSHATTVRSVRVACGVRRAASGFPSENRRDLELGDIVPPLASRLD
jgi:hypothetical protein